MGEEGREVHGLLPWLLLGQPPGRASDLMAYTDFHMRSPLQPDQRGRGPPRPPQSEGKKRGGETQGERERARGEYGQYGTARYGRCLENLHRSAGVLITQPPPPVTAFAIADEKKGGRIKNENKNKMATGTARQCGMPGERGNTNRMDLAQRGVPSLVPTASI